MWEWVNIKGTYANSGRIHKVNGEVQLGAQTTEIFTYFVYTIYGEFTIAEPITLDDTQFIATAGHGISTGDFLCMTENNRKSQMEVNDVNGNIITVAGIFEYEYSINALCEVGSNNLAIDGSIVPVNYYIGPISLPSGTIWHVTHLNIDILDTTAMDDETFGGIPKLTNGITFMKTNGLDWKNLMTVRTNGGIKLRCDQFEYSNKAKSGHFGFNAIRRFSGIDNNGAAIELAVDRGDTIRVTVSDNLTSINRIRVMVHGRTVN